MKISSLAYLTKLLCEDSEDSVKCDEKRQKLFSLQCKSDNIILNYIKVLEMWKFLRRMSEKQSTVSVFMVFTMKKNTPTFWIVCIKRSECVLECLQSSHSL